MPFNNNQDFSSQLDTMLAPYQSAMQRLQQPYPMLGRMGGSLGQNHPLLAGALNQGLEAAAFTPGPQGPEGVGGGISRALQGVLGASQFDRQRMLQSAMLPYQMLQPRLQAEDTLAQIKERGQQGDYLAAHAKYLGEMTDLKGQDLDIKQQRADQAKYGRLLSSPEERFAYARHPFKDPQNPTDDELGAVQREYESIKSKTQHTPMGSYEEQIENMRLNPDPAIKAEGERRWQDHLNTLNVAAGGQAGARKEADQPYEITQRVRAEEQKTILDDLPRKINTTMEAYANIAPNSPAYKKYVAERDAREEERKQRINDFANYLRTDAPNYHEYAANRVAYPRRGDSRGMPSGDNRPTTPSDSGSTWTPKK